MRDWLERYPVLAARHKDSDGRPPQHTWFYPAEAYDPEYLDDLARLCHQRLGEIEGEAGVLDHRPLYALHLFLEVRETAVA